MVIKITRNNKAKKIEYKSSKKILTLDDIKKADKMDLDLGKTIKNIEHTLTKYKIISEDSHKKDPLKVWYIVGQNINQFLKKYPITKEDEIYFWNYLYGRSSLIHKGIPSRKAGLTRNDFKTASILAKFSFKKLQKVGSWALWREIIAYKCVQEDRRILDWITNELIKNPGTRDEARPLLKAVAKRFRNMETTILSDKELLKKIHNDIH